VVTPAYLVDPKARRIVVPRSLHLDAAKLPLTGGEICRLPYALSVKEVEAEADAVVVAFSPQDFLHERSHFARYFEREPNDPDPTEYLESAWTTGALVIEEVKFSKPGVPIEPRQVVAFTEPVGLTIGDQGVVKDVRDDCTEIKQGSRYVLFLTRGDDGAYHLCNMNLGRFNTDGTDPEDEIGGGLLPDGSKTDKQVLREQLSREYGIRFAPPRDGSSPPPSGG
jgi:hypothetical protein